MESFVTSMNKNARFGTNVADITATLGLGLAQKSAALRNIKIKIWIINDVAINSCSEMSTIKTSVALLSVTPYKVIFINDLDNRKLDRIQIGEWRKCCLFYNNFYGVWLRFRSVSRCVVLNQIKSCFGRATGIKVTIRMAIIPIQNLTPLFAMLILLTILHSRILLKCKKLKFYPI